MLTPPTRVLGKKIRYMGMSQRHSWPTWNQNTFPEAMQLHYELKTLAREKVQLRWKSRNGDWHEPWTVVLSEDKEKSMEEAMQLWVRTVALVAPRVFLFVRQFSPQCRLAIRAGFLTTT